MKTLSQLLPKLLLLVMMCFVSAEAFGQNFTDFDTFAEEADSTAGSVVVKFISIICVVAIGGAFMRGTRSFSKGVLAAAIAVALLITLVRTNAIPAVTSGWSTLHSSGSTSASSIWGR